MTTVPWFRDPRQAVKLGPPRRPHDRRPPPPPVAAVRSGGVDPAQPRQPAGCWSASARSRCRCSSIHGGWDLAVPLQTAKDAARRARGDLVVVQRRQPLVAAEGPGDAARPSCWRSCGAARHRGAEGPSSTPASTRPTPPPTRWRRRSTSPVRWCSSSPAASGIRRHRGSPPAAALHVEAAPRALVRRLMPRSSPDASAAHHLEILAISFAALLLEIGYTRVISFKLFYYYTYLVIGLALLGIGSGGVLVAVSGRLRRASTDAILWGAARRRVSVGRRLPGRGRASRSPPWTSGTTAPAPRSSNLGRARRRSAWRCSPRSSSIGVMIADALRPRGRGIGRLYFADLLGAGLACAVAVPLLDSIGPPATIFLAGRSWRSPALRMALPHAHGVSSAVGVALAARAGGRAGGGLPTSCPTCASTTLKTAARPTRTPARVEPVFRVDAADFGDQHAALPRRPARLGHPPVGRRRRQPRPLRHGPALAARSRARRARPATC